MILFISTPLTQKGFGVDYLGFYHFLEGLVKYDTWSDMIDNRTKHKRLKGEASVWMDKKQLFSAFDRLLRKLRDSIFVVLSHLEWVIFQFPLPLWERVRVRGNQRLNSNNITIDRNLRKRFTDAEKLLWRYLRAKQLEGFKFRRQQPIGNYIVDW